MIRRRQWTELDTALRGLDNNVELRVALVTTTDLKKYRNVLTQGRGWEQEWAETRRAASGFLARGFPDKAADLLRRLNISGLNDDLRNDVRRQRLEALQAWREQNNISPVQSLQVCHEMFALVDENSEAALLGELARTIRRLERGSVSRVVNISKLNVTGFTRPLGEKSGGGNEQEQHELYLQGVSAMQESDWATALTCFRQIPGYRQANVFVKSLETLQKEEPGGQSATPTKVKGDN